jgi:hypothetical protein
VPFRRPIINDIKTDGFIYIEFYAVKRGRVPAAH